MAAGKSATWAKVFLFGDSLTQRSFTSDGRWGSLLADFLIRKCDVIPRGFSGYNTRAAKLILPGLLDADTAKDVVAMTILLGANDAACPEAGISQHVPVEEYGNNLKIMVEHCLSVGLRRNQIIIIAPPAAHKEAWDDHCRREGKNGVGTRRNKLVTPYAAMCAKVSEEMGINFMDFHTKMMQCEDYTSFLCDGLHLSESGSQLLFDHLQPIISKLTSHIPRMLYPDFADIKNDNDDVVEQSLKDWL